MAEIHRSTARNNDNKITYLLLAIICFVIGMATFMGVVGPAHLQGGFGAPIVIPGFIFCVLVLKASEYFWNKFRSYSSGDSGRSYTTNFLTALPKEYEVYTNVAIGEAIIDFVIVGCNGVFVINNRNNKGMIECDEHSGSWTIHKEGRGGGKYTSTMVNPLKKMKWQVHVLADYLKGSGCKVWVEGFVFFSNNEVSLSNKPPHCMDNRDELLQFIVNSRPTTYVSSQDISRINSLLQSRIK